jgi:hypothetical protein
MQQGGPALPFTEPALENTEVQTQVEEYAAEVTQESGTFSFIGEFADVVAGWFEGEESSEAYPNLGAIPITPAYGETRRSMDEAKQELEAEREQAQEQQRAISDWSALAEPELPAEAPQSDNIVAPKEIQITAPVVEVPLPEARHETAVPAAITPEIIVKPEPSVGMPANYLRRPSIPKAIFLPRNRYAGRY